MNTNIEKCFGLSNLEGAHEPAIKNATQVINYWLESLPVRRLVFYPHRYPLWRRGKLSYGRYPRLPWPTGGSWDGMWSTATREGRTGEKKSGSPLRQIVRIGPVGLCCKALYSRGPQSINARSAWAPTRHNSRESSGICDAPIVYAVRIVPMAAPPRIEALRRPPRGQWRGMRQKCGTPQSWRASITEHWTWQC